MCKRMGCVLSVLLLLSALFLLPSRTPAQTMERADGTWQLLTSAEGEFSVEFPGAPKYHAPQITSPGVILTAHIYRLVVNSSSYEVWYGDTAPGAAGAEQRLNAGLAKLAESFGRRGGREVARRSSSISATCKEAEWFGMSPQYPTLVVRAIATPKHSYFLVFSSNRTGESTRALYRRFFQSFRFNADPCATGLISPLNRSGLTGPIGPVMPAPEQPAGQNSPDGNSGGIPGGRGNTGGGDLPVVPVPRVNSSGIYNSSEVTKRAMLVSRPAPKYTREARKHMVTGTVRVRAVLTATGRVSNPFVVRGLPYGLNESAIEAARHIKFIPAELEGRKVSQWIDIEYNFNLY